MPTTITIKELHAATGEQVRRAGASRTPVIITDRGHPVAVLAKPSLLKPARRKRILLPEFEAFFSRPSRLSRANGGSVLRALDEIRGDR
jgi:prevent-host-death family protein